MGNNVLMLSFCKDQRKQNHELGIRRSGLESAIYYVAAVHYVAAIQQAS